MDPRHQRVLESWWRARERLTASIAALDSMLLEHPELAPLQIELQALRSEMSDLAESLSVLAGRSI
jgi:hypothetical protein